MAVVQISKIQVRRGKANSGTGLPQLASGEIAWAVDTQELFIGNGSVSEGAPAVGNTKILTEHDNLFDIFTYQYKANDPTITTGIDANHPVVMRIQERLDQIVFASQFGALGNTVPVYSESGDLEGYEGADDTLAVQRALDQLFANAGHVDPFNGIVEPTARVVLQFEPGVYTISETITIPSYASIVGAGIDKTIFRFTGQGPVFSAGVNDLNATNQSRFINLEGFSVTSTDTDSGITLTAVRDSSFKNISITGSWVEDEASSCTGLRLASVTELINCTRNSFTNVNVSSFCYGIESSSDVCDNVFDSCSFTNVLTGVSFGQYGSSLVPHGNTIKDCKFVDVKEYAVNIQHGYDNKVSNCVFENVGNNGAGVASPASTQVVFATAGNTFINNESDRDTNLNTANLTVPFMPVASGIVTHQVEKTNQVTIAQHLSSTLAFRLPAIQSAQGYSVSYVYRSTNFDIIRKGTLTITTNPINNNIEWSDDCDIAAAPGVDVSAFNFSVSLDQVAEVGVTPDTILVSYTNTLNGDVAKLVYTYSLITLS